jgi:hypothetical protein
MDIKMTFDTRWRAVAPPAHAKTNRPFVGAFLAAVSVLFAASVTSKGASLTPETLTAWDTYLHSQSARVAAYSKAAPFLWSDESPDRLRRVRNGEAVISAVGDNPHHVPQGLVHHWIGAIFLPGAHLDDVLSIVRDYGRYKEFYAPGVVDSRVLRHTDTEGRFSLRMVNNTAVTRFALDTDFEETYTRVDENKCYSISYTTRVREVENYGLSDEREAPENTGRGLIWRLYSLSRFEERDGGVYIELEAVALSRDIPVALRWLIDPVVRRTSRNSLRVSLQNTEQAVLGRNRVIKDTATETVQSKSASSYTSPVTRVQNGFRRP